MNSFVSGMGSLTLFPQMTESRESPLNSAWAALAQAFRETGDSMRAAITAFGAQVQNKSPGEADGRVGK
jgi:hypothetical protein